eukprot:5880507-Pyramimonas_sp.AAC.1
MHVQRRDVTVLRLQQTWATKAEEYEDESRGYHVILSRVNDAGRSWAAFILSTSHAMVHNIRGLTPISDRTAEGKLRLSKKNWAIKCVRAPQRPPIAA